MGEAVQFGGIGKPRTRVDGTLKVTGAAAYPSDVPVLNPAYAALVTSSIAKGRIRAFALGDARNVLGVIDILTYQNTNGGLKASPDEGDASETTTLESDKIWHDGQIIAVVVADSYEAAREAAHKVYVEYDAAPASASFGDLGIVIQDAAEVDEEHEDPHVGNAETGFAGAAIKFEAEYETPTQHHNAIELFDTTCWWTDGKLTILEASQFVHGLRKGVAEKLGLMLDDIRVESRFVGGAFGSRGDPTARTALIALAARRVNRPVRLVPTRAQGFTIATYRAETRHQVKLGATANGKLQALVHEGVELSSRPDNHFEGGTEHTARLYTCPNVSTKVSVAHADRNTPGYMRAPEEVPYIFALESAIDELAVMLDMDPVALRKMNDAKREPIERLRYSSRSLIECLDAGARQFGWESRNSRPGSMRKGDWLIGWGCAAAMYPSGIGAAAARLILGPNGAARVQIAAHEIGTGTQTIIAGIVSDRLGIPLQRIDVILGDSDLPPAGMAAGSSHAASVCTVVSKACDEALKRLDRRNEAEGDVIEIYAENRPKGAEPDVIKGLYEGEPSSAGDDKYARYAFGAQFVEVRVHELTREIRVPRMVGAFAAGTIINPMTAKSQLMGGMIWGVSGALHEATEIDRRTARYTNTNFADYLIPVNADIGHVDVLLVPEEDRIVNPLGIKGVGELGVVGMNAAIANAVYHATGVRIRKLPIRLESLL
jgi:xanthine dehydrogenase YagR molybdenum-binding subunit